MHKTEEEIREILEMYFEYVIENQPSKSKVVSIEIGKILKKTTIASDKIIDVQVSSIGFFSNKSKSKKEFRVCDIIDFTFNKHKEHPHLYLIREVLIRLDYSTSKIEKQDETLPDIEIIFKTHPIIQKSTQNLFPESKIAIDIIKEKIDENFILDNHGFIGIFETGQRKIVDKRLDFE